MKRKFLLGVFLLTVLLTSLGTQLVANASIYGIRMVDVHGDTFINDNRFYSGSTRNENPTINVEQGTSVQFYFLVEGERSNSLTFEPYYLVHLPANRDEAIKKVISIRDNLTCNLQDGPAQEIRNGNWFRIRDDIHAIPDFTRKNPEAEEYAKFTINVSENAEVGMTYDFELCAFPCVGYQEGISDQKDMNQKFTINVVKAPEKPKFEKTSPFSITLYQGAIGTFDTDCENLSRCYVDTTPESLDKAGLDYIRTEYDPLPGSMVWPGDKPEHSITFKAKANTKPLYDSDHPSATSKESEWTVHAVSPQGGVRTATLKVTVNATEKTSSAAMTANSITLMQGETKDVKLIGNNIVKNWHYNNNDLSPDIYISLSPDQNPTTCTAHVKVNPDAKTGTHTADIHVFNEEGYAGANPGKLTITVTPNEDHMKPIIDNPEEEVTVLQGGVSTVTFTGKYAKSWLSSRYGSEYFTSKLSTKLDFSKNPNRCDFQVIADETSPIGTYDLYLYAINAAGQRSERAKLTVHVVENEAHTPATIDTNETVSVVLGQRARATFTGKHVRSWTVDNSDVDKYAWIDDIECSYAVNPDRCDMTVITNTGVNADVSEAKIKVYAYNAVGKKSDPATLTIVAAKPDDYKDPVIDTSESVSVIAGGTAKAVFTGQHIRRWGYNMNFSDDIHGIELNYSTNPNRCEVLVTADAKAKAGTYTVTIYAYNEVGEETSATLTVKITTEETKYEDPVIDENEEVSVIA
ncbi:MAG: hypothetical protein SPL87_05205, partial [Synergistales bacterium]|nr:hypothetical protein [Synergistales bacterium]